MLAVDPQDLDLLADSETHEPLELDDNCLINAKSGRSYPIRDESAVFLEEVSGPNRSGHV